MIAKITKRAFSSAQSAKPPLTTPQLSAIQSILTTTLRNLYFLQHNLCIVFTTSIVFSSDNLRTLRKLNTQHIESTLKKVLSYRASPPLVGYLDAPSIAFRNALLLQCSRKYEIGRTLRRIEDNIDQRLRQMNVQDIEEKQLRQHLIGIRQSYHPYSQEYLSGSRPKIYDYAEKNILTDLINSVLNRGKGK